ncbi:S1 family peptidase [Saccharothrix australiensis]|uniref:Trypsin-like peptidase n=1 Tax=Saccharothrix australiensis TaxID=2072 RepID=A0A495VZY5_9PSEU|nr:serine protease [Saccharothrix australiensis]RKT54769.1 trypsin-like peptidase [Saccharothrix australiensis]
MRVFRRTWAALGAALLGLAVVAPPAWAADVDFTGAVDVDGCSGSLVRMPTSRDGDRALVLTNGHCYEGAWPVPDEVLVDQPSHRLLTLLDGKGERVADVHAAKVLYATMTGTDITLYQLDTSYRDLQRRHRVRPLTVSAERPAAGAGIRVVSGSMKTVFSCHVDQLVYRLLEKAYVAKDVVRYTQACATGPGTSGSPVVDAASGQVVAINSTSNREGGQCTLDNPCEMDRDGVITVRKGSSYATQTYWLTTCMGAGNKLDLGRRGCLLPEPSA